MHCTKRQRTITDALVIAQKRKDSIGLPLCCRKALHGATPPHGERCKLYEGLNGLHMDSGVLDLLAGTGPSLWQTLSAAMASLLRSR